LSKSGTEAPEALFDKMASLHVLVLGDAMLDAYMWGSITRSSPEAPVPVVDIIHREDRLGGAANVALNIVAMGAKATLVSVVGEDKYGESFQRLLKESGIKTNGILAFHDRKTTVKTRIISDNKHVLRVDEEDSSDISTEEEVLDHVRQLLLLENFDVVIFEDYNKGLLTGKVIEGVIALCREKGIPTAVDPKKKNFLSYSGCTLFKPNRKEMEEGLGISVQITKEGLHDAVEQLQARMRCEAVLLTLSEHGVYFENESLLQHLPAFPRNIIDVSGAGDTVIALAALALASKCPPEWIALIANLAGGQVCEKVGVVTVDRALIKEEFIKLIA
jgi:rfaE bifunctional protein kinase chain/domain